MRITPIRRADIKGPAIYSDKRDDFRKATIEHKHHRRIAVGDRVSLVFENRHTLLFQTEEMLRAESITEDDKIQEEIDVYNALMPTDTTLSATLFIELSPNANPRVELDRLVGLDEHVILHIGSYHLRALFEPGRATGERISAVQYLRFEMPAAAKTALLAENTTIAVEIDHPEYQHKTFCREETRASLAGDYQPE